MRIARRNKLARPRGPNFSLVGERPLGDHEIVWNGILHRQRWTATVLQPRLRLGTPKGERPRKDVAVPGSLSDRLAAHIAANPGEIYTSHRVADLLAIDVYRGAVILLRVARRGLLKPADASAARARHGRPLLAYQPALPVDQAAPEAG